MIIGIMLNRIYSIFPIIVLISYNTRKEMNYSGHDSNNQGLLKEII